VQNDLAGEHAANEASRTQSNGCNRVKRVSHQGSNQENHSTGYDNPC
jgi:hypothetical protein